MLIDVAETHPPKIGKKVAAVIAADGQKYEIWPEMLAGIQVGRRYDADVEERDYQGRKIRKITKATPAGAAPAQQEGSGQFARGRISQGQISDEVYFVGKALHALIIKGDAVYTKKSLYDATELLRGLYGATFGNRQGNAP